MTWWSNSSWCHGSLDHSFTSDLLGYLSIYLSTTVYINVSVGMSVAGTGTDMTRTCVCDRMYLPIRGKLRPNGVRYPLIYFSHCP